MAQCNYCDRVWNSWGGGYEYCDDTCFLKHWQQSINEAAERHQMESHKIEALLQDLLGDGIIKTNDNY